MGENSQNNGEVSEEEEKKVVGARVKEKRRQKWEQYVDDSAEFGTMAQLIRTAVEKEISEDESEYGRIRHELGTLRQDVDRLFSMIDDNRVQIVQEIGELNDPSARDVAEETAYVMERTADEVGSVGDKE